MYPQSHSTPCPAGVNKISFHALSTRTAPPVACVGQRFFTGVKGERPSCTRAFHGGCRTSRTYYDRIWAMVLNVDPITVLGLVAGAFTTLAFVPQVIRTWQLKSAADLSIAMIGLNSTGVFLWLIYGLYVRSLPIVVANLVTFVDRKSTRLNSSHRLTSRMPSSA